MFGEDEEIQSYGYIKYHERRPLNVKYVRGNIKELFLDGVSYGVRNTDYGKEKWYDVIDHYDSVVGHYFHEENTLHWITTEEMMKHDGRVCIPQGIIPEKREDMEFGYYKQPYENHYNCCD